MKETKRMIVERELSTVNKPLSEMIEWIFDMYRHHPIFNKELCKMISSISEIVSRLNSESSAYSVYLAMFKISRIINWNFTYTKFEVNYSEINESMVNTFFSDWYQARLFFNREFNRIAKIVFKKNPIESKLNIDNNGILPIRKEFKFNGLGFFIRINDAGEGYWRKKHLSRNWRGRCKIMKFYPNIEWGRPNPRRATII